MEDSLTLGAHTYTPASQDSPYTFITKDDGVKVTIEAGKYDCTPTDSTGSSNLYKHASGMLLANRANWSELVIDSRVFDPTAQNPYIGTSAFPFNYRITNIDTKQVWTASQSSGWDPTEAVYRMLLPAGNYMVEAEGPDTAPNRTMVASRASGASQGNSNGVAIKLGSSTTALHDATVSVNPYLNTTDIDMASSQNTVVFVQAYAPTVKITKQSTDTNGGLPGAVFTLYKLNASSNAYEKTNISAVSDGTTHNNVTFPYLSAGEYIAVETEIPDGHASNLDLTVFSGAPASVLASSVPAGITEFSVTQSDYAQSAYAAIQKGVDLTENKVANKLNKNTPAYTIALKARDAVSGADMSPAKFRVYKNTGNDENPIWTPSGDELTTYASGWEMVTDSGGSLRLGPGEYKVVQTGLPDAAAGSYAMTGEAVYFKVDATGLPTLTKWTQQDNQVTTPNGIINYSAFSASTAAKNIQISFGQVKQPGVNFKKFGETNEIRDDKLETIPLHGGQFRVYYYDTAGNKVYIDLDSDKDGVQDTTYAQNDPHRGELAGLYGDTQFDPLKTYYLEETRTPAYQGLDDTLVVYRKNPDIEFKFEPDSDGKTFKAKVKGADGVNGYGKKEKYVSWETSFFKITNYIEPYYIHITKLPVRPVGDTNAKYETGPNSGESLDFGKSQAETGRTPQPGEMTIDYKSQAEKESGWANLHVNNAKFPVYQVDPLTNDLVDADTSTPKIDPLQVLVTATNGTDSVNDALSAQLPPGKYWIQESAPAINFAPPGDFSNMDGGNKYNQSSSLYKNNAASGMGVNIKNPATSPEVDDWSPSSGVKDEKGAGFMIEIPEMPDPDTSDAERTYELVLGNSTRLDSGQSRSPDTWIQVHAWKNGASRLPWSGTAPFNMKWDENANGAGKGAWIEDPSNQVGRLSGVRFHLSPAIYTGTAYTKADLNDPKNYTELPTIDNKHLDNLVSKKKESMVSQWIPISRVFGGAKFEGNASSGFKVTNAVSNPNDPMDVHIDWEAWVGNNPVRFEEAKKLSDPSNHADIKEQPYFGWGVVWVEDRSSLPSVFQAEADSGHFVSYGSFVTGVDGMFSQKQDPYNKASDAYGTNMKGNANAPEITNVRGIGTLEVIKEQLGSQGKRIKGASFNLYRIPDASVAALHAGSPASWNAAGLNGVDYVKTRFTPDTGHFSNLEAVPGGKITTAGDGGFATMTGLKPGYYYLLETDGSASYNTYGQYDIDYPDGAYMPADSNNNAFGKDTEASSKLIGPIEISDRNDSNFIVTVKDKKKASIAIRNWWGNALLYDSSYTGTYGFTAKPADSSAGPYVAAGANPLEIADLADGEYTVKLSALSGDTHFVMNPDVAAGKLTFTVKDGVCMNVKLDGAELDTAQNGNVWKTEADGAITINVNHSVSGALIIRKGGIDAKGALKNYLGTAGADAVPANLTSASFRLEVKDGNAEWSLAASEGSGGILTWDSADFATGMIESLPVGKYRIKEIAVSDPTAWEIDTEWVYFDILPGGGAVYLTNSNRLTGQKQDGTAGNPLQSSVNADVRWFYNRSQSGTLGIYKLNSALSNTNIGGAAFYLYPSADSKNPSGPPVAKLEYGKTTYYSWPQGTPVNADPAQDSSHTDTVDSSFGKFYAATVRGGDYVVREVQTPSEAYALRRGYEPIAVAPGKNGIAVGSFMGYGNAGNVNAIGFLDPQVPTLKVKKTADYPSISGLPAQDKPVAGFPFTLYKRINGVIGDNVFTIYDAQKNPSGNFVEYMTQTSWPGETEGAREYGISAFPIDEEGEYRVIEKSLGVNHDYLGYNPDFEIRGNGTLLGTGNSVFASYNAASNAIDLSYTPRDANSKWESADNLMTVKNPFTGYQVAAKKLDYFTGKPIAGATFTLYATEEDARNETNPVRFAAEAPNTATADPDDLITVMREQKFTTDENGLAYFDPFFLSHNEHSRTYWIRETAPPDGYVTDEWYDARIKKVTVTDNQGSNTAAAIFADGKVDEPKLLAGKFHNALTFSPASATSVNKGSLTTDYVLIPQIGTTSKMLMKNRLPLYGYTITDNDFTFRSGKVGEYTDIKDSVISPNNMPTYKINTVKVKPSFAWASAADEKAGNEKAAVWANVIGIAADGTETARGWQRLTEERTWLIGGSYTGFKVIYSQMDPAGESATDVYGNTAGEAGYWVGTGFVPGEITYNVTFDRFSAMEDQPEITNIQNTAVVTATHGFGANAKVLEKVTAGENIDFDVAARPKMSVTKTLDTVFGHKEDGSMDSSNEKTDLQNKPPESGDYFDYTLTLENDSAEDAGLVYPILIDYFEKDAMTLVGYKLTIPGSSAPYTKSWEGEPDNEWTGFKNHGNAYAVWKFPDLTLGKGEAITVKVRVRLNGIVPRSHILNEAYGTSGVPLAVSGDYPTGASFEAMDMKGSNAVYIGSAANAKYQRPASSANTAAEYYAKLSALGDEDFMQSGGRNLFVRAATDDIPIVPASSVQAQKSVMINDSGIWHTDEDREPVDVGFGDTVTYRLRIQTPAGTETKGLKMYDLLPYTDDSRSTAWNAELLHQFRLTGAYDVNISTVGSPQVAQKSTTSRLTSRESLRTTSFNPGLAEDATAVCFDFAGTTIPGNSIITVEYKLKLVKPGEGGAPETPDIDELLAANALKTAGNSIDASIPFYDRGASQPFTTVEIMKQDAVYLRLRAPSAQITGTVWEDRNINGIRGDSPSARAALAKERADSPDTAMNGVAVKLHKYVGGAEVFKPEAGAAAGSWEETTTSSSGSYSFKDLESSYGTADANAITYRVEVAAPAPEYYFTTKAADAAGSNDSDVFGREKNGAQHKDAGFSSAIPVNTAAVIDAGLYRKSDMRGKVWRDSNRDGRQSPAESGMSGVTVVLQKSADGRVWTTATKYIGGSAPASAVSGLFTGIYALNGLELPYGDTNHYRLLYNKSGVESATRIYRWTAKDRGDDVADSDVTPWKDDLSAPGASTTLDNAIAGPNSNLGYHAVNNNNGAGLYPADEDTRPGLPPGNAVINGDDGKDDPPGGGGGGKKPPQSGIGAAMPDSPGTETGGRDILPDRDPPQSKPPAYVPDDTGPGSQPAPSRGEPPVMDSEPVDEDDYVWSLFSLLLSLIAIIAALCLALRAVLRRQAGTYTRRALRHIHRALTIALAFVPGIIWLLLDDLSLPMAWFNKWTPHVTIAFAVFLIAFILLPVHYRRAAIDKERTAGT
ncbi:MAG: hypothetical protein LBC58_05940 [Clostridiales Family XIII bacterium]|nr:hypothetical protein [Clostridiales Family XIII bacterium]